MVQLTHVTSHQYACMIFNVVSMLLIVFFSCFSYMTVQDHANCIPEFLNFLFSLKISDYSYKISDSPQKSI